MPYKDPARERERQIRRRPAKRAYMKDYYAENRPARLAYQNARHAAQREAINSRRRDLAAQKRIGKVDGRTLKRTHRPPGYYSLRYRLRHPEEMRARSRAWRHAHRDLFAHYQARRRARRVAAGGSHTITEWREKCALFANLCAYCGEARRLERDHKIPLIRGGSDDITNIVPACHSCNASKHKKTAAEYLAATA